MADHPLKGRKQSPEHVAARIAAKRANGTLSGYRQNLSTEQRAELSRRSKRLWAEGAYQNTGRSKCSPETIEKMREAKRRQWAEGVYANKRPATRRRVSQMERALKPYLAALGYRHTEEQECFIACSDRTRMPDYVDVDRRRVFEFFGDFWHDPADEQAWVDRYAEKGWACTVLWEHDLPGWLAAHEALVAPEEHRHALKVSRVRSSGKRPL